MSENINGLVVPQEHEIKWLTGVRTVRSWAKSDFPNWDQVLMDPKLSPVGVMEIENQERSDCNGNTCANNLEWQDYVLSGRTKMQKASEIAAYTLCEFLMDPSGRGVGLDRGTSIHSATRLLIGGVPQFGLEPGVPYEAQWPYSRYCRSLRELRSFAPGKPVMPSTVAQVDDMPPWDDLLPSLAAGCVCQIGTKWPPRFKTPGGQFGRFRLMDDAPTGAGGHATAILWAIKIAGNWYLIVWNSHGYGAYLMSRRCYESLQRSQFAPFGAYLLSPKDPVSVYNRVLSGGGYYD